MGSLFSSRTRTSRQPFESNPWTPQQPYIQGGFDGATSALDNAMAVNGGITDFTADMTSDQNSIYQQMINSGQGLANGAQTAITAGQGAMGNLGTFNDQANGIFNRANTNQTGNIINDASQYANNPHLQGQIDSALGDVRTAFDRDVAGINSGAAGTGNINSTRAGALEARAMDDAMDRGAMISSNMRGDAYQQGLNMAQNQNNMSTSQMLAANGQTAQGAGMGMDFMGAGGALQSQGYGMAGGAAGAYQTQAQNEINGLQGGAQTQMDLMQQYMATIGGNYGSNGFNSTTTQSQSPFQSILGGISTIAGIM